MINVHDFKRNSNNQLDEMLIVTDDAQYCHVKINPKTGSVRTYNGTIWPGELPGLFVSRRVQGLQQTYIRWEVQQHFQTSTSSLEVYGSLIFNHAG